MPEAVAVAVSGGRDSLLAMALLKEQGHAVVALHGLFLPDGNEHLRQSGGGASSPSSRLRGEDEDEEKTERPGPDGGVMLAKMAAQCAAIGVELHVADLRREFEALVAGPFAAEYAAGRTPNPCALCNPRIKFGLLMDAARKLGAEKLATGHYARLVEHPRYGRVLAKGLDATREQSYFLALVPKERLDRALFPLGDLHKRDVLPMLEARGLTPPLPAESREVCFVPGDDYQAYLLERGAQLPGPGPAMLADGTPVGRHQGLWRHTLGQRRGLGIAWKEPLYVIGKDVADNVLILGPREATLSRGCLAGPANLLVPPESWPETVQARTRYRQAAVPARVEPRGNMLAVTFADPHDRPAPGQVCALYDNDVLLAGGTITEP